MWRWQSTCKGSYVWSCVWFFIFAEASSDRPVMTSQLPYYSSVNTRSTTLLLLSDCCQSRYFIISFHYFVTPSSNRARYISRIDIASLQIFRCNKYGSLHGPISLIKIMPANDGDDEITAFILKIMPEYHTISKCRALLFHEAVLTGRYYIFSFICLSGPTVAIK